MLTLHLGDYQGRFALWAETIPFQDLPLTDFPFQASLPQFQDLLRELGLPAAESLETVWLWAPAHDGYIFGSGPLPEGLHLAPKDLNVWLVPALELVALLQDLQPLPELRYAPEFKLWQQLLRLATSLLQRQRLLPELSQQERWQAGWTPLLEPEDHIYLGRLAQTMPGSVRALNPQQSEQAPQRSAESILKLGLQQFCNALIQAQALAPESGALTEAEQSPAEAWLQALRSGQTLEQPEKDLLRLKQQLEAWSGGLRRRANAPFQLVLQLEEPSETSESWYLRLLLRPLAEPSLYLPLDYLWVSAEQQPEVLRQQAQSAREYLADSLTLLVELCGSLQPLLQQRQPVGLELELDAVAELLRVSESLEAAGFGLRLPSWWLKGRQRLSASVRFAPPAFNTGSELSMKTLLQADWQLMLGDQTLSLADLQELAQFKSELVQWQGQWLLVEPDSLRRARRFFGRQAGNQISLGQAVAINQGAEELPFEITAAERAGWLDEFMRRLESGEHQEVEVPASFKGHLRPYQLRGLNWLAFLAGHGLGACLADDMGLGKTVQTLALIEYLRLQHPQQRPGTVLLVCPTSLLSNWLWEAQHFTPALRVAVHHGSKRLKGAEFESALQELDILVTSYALLGRDKELLCAQNWSGIVLDEGQNIKNPETQQAKVACALPAHWRLTLTGTPVENHIGDLWSLMNFLHPGLLGGRQFFQETFLTPIQRWQDADALKRLRRMIAPFVLRRLKSDRSIVADLPDKLEMKVHCSLTREQASLYMAVLQELEAALERVDGMARRGLILATLTKLKQICNHPAQYLGERQNLGGRSGKLMRLKEMITEILEMNEKSLIFTQYAEMAGLLQRYLADSLHQQVLLLHGGIPASQRPALIQRFQQDSEARIFVLSLKAGGTGLNLTAANHVFHYDRWWNPAIENQATDRAYRIGQSKQVQVHAFVCSGTLEDRIDQILTHKRGLAEQIVSSGEHWLTEFSNQELYEFFALDLQGFES